MSEVKAATTYEQQLDILRRRGVVIENEAECVEILKNLNYYRLVAYFLPYKQSDDTYVPGTSFLHVYR